MDLRVELQGEAVLFRPLTPVGEAWLEDHVLAPGWARFGAALTVEDRFVPEIVDAARDEGLEVAGAGEEG
jgi:hypothetical protein